MKPLTTWRNCNAVLDVLAPIYCLALLIWACGPDVVRFSSTQDRVIWITSLSFLVMRQVVRGWQKHKREFAPTCQKRTAT